MRSGERGSSGSSGLRQPTSRSERGVKVVAVSDPQVRAVVVSRVRRHCSTPEGVTAAPWLL